MNDTRDFTAHGAENVSVSSAQVGGQRPISTEQEANLRALAEVLSEDSGWLLWGPLLAMCRRTKKLEPKVPCWIDGAGRVLADGWNVAANTHGLNDAMGRVGQTPDGGGGRSVLGVGFAFREGVKANPLAVVLDFDACIEDGKPGEFAQEVLGRFGGTYCETSPSGTGLRIVCLADEAWKWPYSTGKQYLTGGGEVEVFTPSNSKGKFFRLSGNRWAENTAAVTEQGKALRWLTSLLPVKEAGASGTGDSSDPAELLAQLQELAPFRRKNGWSDEAKKPDDVYKALTTAAGKARKEGRASALAHIMNEEFDKVCNGNRSDIDIAICCEAIRRGARTPEHVEAVWKKTKAYRHGGKPDKHSSYVATTITAAARAVLADARKADGGDGGNGGVDGQLRERIAALEAAAGVPLEKRRGGRLALTPVNVEAVFNHSERVSGCLHFNTWLNRPERAGNWRERIHKDASAEPGRLDDSDLTWLGKVFETEAGIVCTPHQLWNWALAASKANRCNPVEMTLRECHAEWLADGGEKRLAAWLIKHAKAQVGVNGVDLTEYLARVGTLTLLSAVSRAMKPGCKADSHLALLGGGGGGKSTLCEVLAGALGEGMFTDGVQDFGKDSQSLSEKTEGCVIAELAESQATRGIGGNRLKAILSLTRAMVRRPYAPSPVEWRPGHIYITTANDPHGFLRGGDGPLRRRYWPVLVTATQDDVIDFQALKKVARLLWGEAFAMWQALVEAGHDPKEMPLFLPTGREPGRHDASNLVLFDPAGDAAAFAGWQTLLGGMADEGEGGPFLDKLVSLNAYWWARAEQKEMPTIPRGLSANPDWNEPPEENAPLWRMGAWLGHDPAQAPRWLHQVADWCRAAKLHVRRWSDGTRVGPSLTKPREE